MKEIQDFITFLLQFNGAAINRWYEFILILLSVIIISLLTVYDVCWKRSKNFSLLYFVSENFISAIIIILLLMIFGDSMPVFILLAAVFLSLFINEKYLKTLFVSSFTKEEKLFDKELSRLKKEFANNPHYSILEVLLYYGYISDLQKEYIETENIFDTPEEMAEKLLKASVLTVNQLNEAKAIMNVIRKEGKILTRQEALLYITKLTERRKANEEIDKKD